MSLLFYPILSSSQINLPGNNSIPLAIGLRCIKLFIFDLVSIKRIINAQF